MIYSLKERERVSDIEVETTRDFQTRFIRQTVLVNDVARI